MNARRLNAASGMIALAFISLVASVDGRPQDATSVKSKMEEAEKKWRSGSFPEAISAWEEARQLYIQAKDPDHQIDVLLREVVAYEALGQTQLASATLDKADGLTPNDSDWFTKIKAAKGAIAIFSSAAKSAPEELRQSLKEANDAGQRVAELAAAIHNNRGVLLAAQGNKKEAQEEFEDALRDGSAVLRAKVEKNLADLALSSGNYGEAKSHAQRAKKGMAALPEGHEKVFFFVGLADLLEKISRAEPKQSAALRLEAFALDREAARLAADIKDRRAQAFVLGSEGVLYEDEKRYNEALELTRQAVSIAQEVQSLDALYRWERQTGRLLASLDKKDAAIDAYERSTLTLDRLRTDISLRYGNANTRSSFHEEAGPVYHEYSDLLFQKAEKLQSDDPVANADEVQRLLRKARDATESMKAAELESYFQDSCVNLFKSEQRSVETISLAAAVIYVVPFPDRVELLVSLGQQNPKKRLPSDEDTQFGVVRMNISAARLANTARAFRRHLEKPGPDGVDAYKKEARELYRWLIAPIERLIKDRGTLVFVPDGALATIPMGALMEGDEFLIERKAVAVTPSVKLLPLQPADRQNARVMIRGLSVADGPLPALKFVKEEVCQIEQLYPKSDCKMDQDFTVKSMKSLEKGRFTIVHIASHGSFFSDAGRSVIRAYNEDISMDCLQSLLRPAQLSNHPIDLLALSACDTANGDDRAALGLAGIAVKAGARSAFASLWAVNDQATAKLVREFYQNLRDDPNESKATALQKAQQKLIHEYHWRDNPRLWAPYLLIGNWL